MGEGKTQIWNVSETKVNLKFWQVSVGDFLKNDWKSHQGGLQMTSCVLLYKNDLVRKHTKNYKAWKSQNEKMFLEIPR